MSWYEDFLQRLQDLNDALGGDPVVLSSPSSFEADSLILLLAAANAAAGGGGGGGGYTRVNPRVREMGGVAISDTGQNYALSSIPQTGNYLIHCYLDVGRGTGGLSVAFAGPNDATKPVPTVNGASPGTVGDGYGFTSGTYIFLAPGHVWIPAEEGQVWARRAGTYTSGAQTYLDVLGYMEI